MSVGLPWRALLLPLRSSGMSGEHMRRCRMKPDRLDRAGARRWSVLRMTALLTVEKLSKTFVSGSSFSSCKSARVVSTCRASHYGAAMCLRWSVKAVRARPWAHAVCV